MNRCETKKSIHVKNVKGSIVLLRDVKGSILVNDAESCMFTSHCEQIRIHNSKNTLFALAIPNSGCNCICMHVTARIYTIRCSISSG